MTLPIFHESMSEADAEGAIHQVVSAIQKEFEEKNQKDASTTATLIDFVAPEFHETMGEEDAQKAIKGIVDK